MNKRQKVMTGRRNRHRGMALMLVMILVVVAGILGISYITGSTVQMVSSDNLVWASRARYLAESGIEHATWMLKTDSDAQAALQNTWMGPFHVAGTADSYVFTGVDLGNGLYEVRGRGTTHGISQTTSIMLQLTSYYEKLVNAWEPICYWRLGESGGMTAADCVSGINGTYHGVWLGRTGAIVGDSDTSGRFNGMASYVEIPHSDAFLVDNGTVLLWFKVSVTDRAGLFSKDGKAGGTGGRMTIEMQNRSVGVRLRDKEDEHELVSQETMVGQWYFVAFTFGSNGMKLYLNGQLVDSNGYAGGMGTTSGGIGNYEPIAIGAGTRASDNRVLSPLKEYFTGLIDEVAVFGRVLTPEQIALLYDARIPGRGASGLD